jgi:putative ABC transport system permease protein
VKFLPLVMRNLWRRKVRTIFTAFSILIAFFLFGFLGAIRTAFSAGVDVTGADRLMTTHKVSIILPLPISYLDRIAQVPEVKEVTHANWFGGIYKDPKNFFPQYAVDPATYLDIYPEIRLPEAQKKAWVADRTGAIVGRVTAQRFGFKVGDHVPIQATIFVRRDGSKIFDFNIDGIYDAPQGFDTSALIFHYDYLQEGATASYSTDQVGWYIFRITDKSHAQQVVDRVDAMFKNSHAETKTATEKAFAEGFAKQTGNIGVIITGIVSTVFFTMLLVAGNTMAQSVRERTNEIGVLKTLGYGNEQVMGLVLGESCLLALVPAISGLLLAWAAVSTGDPTGGFLPVFYLPSRDLVVGVLLAVGLGVAAGALPAANATRLRIVDALRRV